MWGLLVFVFLLVNIYRLSSAVLFEELMIAFQTTGAQLGTLHAMFFWIYAIFQIPAGLLADRLGPRLTVGCGAIIMNIGAVVFAISTTYSSAVMGRFLIGLGASVVFISVLRFCANWFTEDEFTTMNGLSFAVSGIGGILATTPLAIFAEAIGWRWALGGLGFVGLAVSALVFSFVRDQPKRKYSIDDQITKAPAIRTELSRIFSDRVIWLSGILLFCTTGVNLTLFGLWGIPYIVQLYGTSVTYASMFTLLGGIGILVGPPAIGAISTRFGTRSGIIILGAGTYIVVLSPLALFTNLPLIVVALSYFMAGFLLGSFVLTYPIVKERFTVQSSGISMGTINGAAFLGASVLPIVMGLALDAYWTGEFIGGVRIYTAFGYQLAFGVATVCAIVTFICAILIHFEHVT